MRYKTKIITCLCSLIAGFSAINAEEYPVNTIPLDLLENANAIIRNEETIFTQTNENNATEKVTKVITILNDKGKGLANIVIHQDRFHELKSFSGGIYHATGKLFKKIGKNDLTTTAYSSDLASDDYYSYYAPSAPSYPYTIKYEYEVKWKNGVVNYPSFTPVPNFTCAVEKSTLILHIPSNISVRTKINNIAKAPARTLVGKDSIFIFSCKNFNAISIEPMHPPYDELFPVINIAPTNFCYDKYCGDMSSWKGVGIFLTELQKQRTTLSPETIARLQQMTASAKDDRAKVKILYEYLQDKTRYVSIQLGIGGWQPIPAAQVDKTGFGDC